MTSSRTNSETNSVKTDMETSSIESNGSETNSTETGGLKTNSLETNGSEETNDLGEDKSEMNGSTVQHCHLQGRISQTRSEPQIHIIWSDRSYLVGSTLFQNKVF